MPPKKRDCDRNTVDNELFLQAFEKPTQIYRYLAKRHVTNPLFLNRSLTYMNHRMSRCNKQRKNFKIDAMLKIKENKIRMDKASIFGDNITLKFIGFYDKALWNNNNNNINNNNNNNNNSKINNNLHKIHNGNGKIKTSSTICSSSTSSNNDNEEIDDGDNDDEDDEEDDDEDDDVDDDDDDDAVDTDSNSNSENINTNNFYNVRVETILLKVSHNKRKDSSSAVQQESMGVIDLSINPSNDLKCPSIKIPTESFMPLSENQNKSFFIFLKVELIQKINNTDIIDDDEPLSKRFKPNIKYYGSELSIFDKHSRCVLSVGQYDVALQEIKPTIKNSTQKKLINWETIQNNDVTNDLLLDNDNNPFNIFKKFPSIKFLLEWTNNLNDDYINLNDHNNESKDINLNNQLNLSNNNIKIDNNNKLIMTGQLEEENVKIVYNFMYNNNSRQQTEYSQVSICPWCSLSCRKLYALLKHLKSCHPRFNFTYVPMHGDAARIDVTINDMYDGSYAGSPYDLVGPTSIARRHGTTVRRTVVTNLLVCRPRRQKANLSEFLELDENEINNQRPYITGHNRLYHHTETCLPVNPKELDYDSESEHDPLWLRYKTMQMIDEFTDVNEGEKELMKMWNLHIMKHGYVGDCQLPIACDMFLELKGKELIKKNLYRNFVLHMCSLLDYGLVSPECVYKTIQNLQEMLSTYQEGQQIISDSREKQSNYWLTYGMQKQVFKEQQQKEQEKQQQIQQKLKSPIKNNLNDMKIITNSTLTTKSIIINSDEHQKIIKKNLELKLELKRNSMEKLKSLGDKLRNSATTNNNNTDFISKNINLNKKLAETTINLQSNKRKLRVSEKSLTRRLSTPTITSDNFQKTKDSLKSRRRSVAVLNTNKIINDH